MGRAVGQFDKEVSFKLGKGVEYVAWNCMGHAVRQFDKEVSFKIGKGVQMLHGTVRDKPSASSKKEVSFKPETELGYVTSNCMGQSVRQFEKEARKRGRNVTSACMGRAVR